MRKVRITKDFFALKIRKISLMSDTFSTIGAMKLNQKETKELNNLCSLFSQQFQTIMRDQREW